MIPEGDLLQYWEDGSLKSVRTWFYSDYEGLYYTIAVQPKLDLGKIFLTDTYPAEVATHRLIYERKERWSWTTCMFELTEESKKLAKELVRKGYE